VIYFRTDHESISDDMISKLEIDNNCQIEVCNSWHNFLSILNSRGDWPIPALMLFDLNAYKALGISAAELSNMLVSFYKCAGTENKTILGIVIERICTPDVIKEIRKSDVLGLMPGSLVFGYENTSAALGNLLTARSHWSKKITDMVSKEFKHVSVAGIYLTDRQKQVLALVCNRGLSNKKIAQILHITESTVKVHISAILKEYGVRNRTQLALAAISSLKP
jgi:DNA-binding NarL/FixJ family response regulator